MVPFATVPLNFHGILGAHKVQDPEPLKRWLRELVHYDGFPGPLPVSIDTSFFDTLRQTPAKDWWVSPKLDGVRGLLVCTTLGDGLKAAFLVDRALELWVLDEPMRLPTGWFHNTVFDGEIFEDGFVIFDALVVSGVAVGHRPFTDRLRAITRAFVDYPPAGNEFKIEVKEYVTGDTFVKLGSLTTHGDARPADGMIIMKNESPVTYGRDFQLFKLKPHHSVDFLAGSDGVSAQVYSKSRHVTVAKFPTAQKPKSIVECLVDATGCIKEVLAVRSDKTHANDMLTYQKTTLNAKENLTPEHVRKVFAESVFTQ